MDCFKRTNIPSICTTIVRLWNELYGTILKIDGIILLKDISL